MNDIVAASSGEDTEFVTRTAPEPTNPSRESRQYCLFTQPRTASNLLIQILNLEEQPSLLPGAKIGYYFLPSMATRFVHLNRRYLNEWDHTQREMMRNCLQSCYEELETTVRASRKTGKDVFFKEHLSWLIEPVTLAKVTRPHDELHEEMWMVDASEYGKSRSALNETVFPDEYLMKWQATFLIRHPALMVPSLYRTTVDTEGEEAAKNDPWHESEVKLSWSRKLYDFYKEQYRSDKHEDSNMDDGIDWPIVLDADDIINEPEVVSQYVKAVGLDKDKLKFEWQPLEKEQLENMHRIQRRMKSTLLASSGVQKSRRSTDIDVAEEAAKWRAEFGEDTGARIEGWVRDAMPDYEYLRERRLRGKP